MNQASQAQVEQQELEISCADQQIISATLFTPVDKQINGAVMIAPATGIKQSYYFPFATWLAQQGYYGITYDNRGIGQSLEGKLKECPASLQDWGELDMPAVLDTLIKHAPAVKYHLVGHSAGGQLTGLMHNANRFSSMFNFACSSGNLSQMKYPFRFHAHFFMNVFIPLSNLVFGYSKSHWVGMGESLPKAAARQWSRWCNGAGYVKTDFGKSIKEHYYDRLHLPSLWVHALDDNIANIATVNEMMAVYTNSDSNMVTLNPSELKLKSIGHMGYFKRTCNDLWPMTLDWLEQHS